MYASSADNTAAKTAVPPLSPPVAVKTGSTGLVGDGGFFAALARGYFKDEGLDVELIPLRSSAESLPALAIGELDFASSAVDGALLLGDADPGALQRGEEMHADHGIGHLVFHEVGQPVAQDVTTAAGSDLHQHAAGMRLARHVAYLCIGERGVRGFDGERPAPSGKETAARPARGVSLPVPEQRAGQSIVRRSIQGGCATVGEVTLREMPMTDDQPHFAAGDVEAVVRAAFLDRGDHSSTVRTWTARRPPAPRWRSNSTVWPT